MQEAPEVPEAAAVEPAPETETAPPAEEAKTEEEALNLIAEGWQVVGKYDGKPMFRRMA